MITELVNGDKRCRCVSDLADVLVISFSASCIIVGGRRVWMMVVMWKGCGIRI